MIIPLAKFAELHDKIKIRDAKIASLKSDVERLTKAGNNLVYVASEDPVSESFIKAWFAAKDGKDAQ